MSVPKELNYATNKPVASFGKPEILRFRSNNSTYSGGDVITIEIPTGRSGMHLFPHNTYFEAKLQLNTTSTANPAPIYIDQSAYSMFYRMRVLHGTEVLEDTMYCSRLWNSLYDVQRSRDKRGSDSNTLLTDSWATGTSGATVGGWVNGMVGKIIGTTVGTNATVQNLPATPIDFTFVLPSSILGSLATKALPLGLMGASSIYIELTLENTQIPFNSNVGFTLNSYTLSDIYLNCKCSSLPNDVETAIINSTDGIINLPAYCYKGEQKYISPTSSSFNDKFAFSFSSIKNFLFFFTNGVTAQGGLTKRSITSRQFANLAEWYLLINGAQYPSQPINTQSKMFMELMRSFDSLTDTNAGGILDYQNYAIGTGATANDVMTALDTSTHAHDSISGRFIAGVDLDRFNHSSDTLLSGTSTIGQSLNLNLHFSDGLVEGNNLYAFVMYDVNYVLQYGLLRAKF
jgi:hypothetical protein